MSKDNFLWNLQVTLGALRVLASPDKKIQQAIDLLFMSTFVMTMNQELEILYKLLRLEASRRSYTLIIFLIRALALPRTEGIYTLLLDIILLWLAFAERPSEPHKSVALEDVAASFDVDIDVVCQKKLNQAYEFVSEIIDSVSLKECVSFSINKPRKEFHIKLWRFQVAVVVTVLALAFYTPGKVVMDSILGL